MIGEAFTLPTPGALRWARRTAFTVIPVVIGVVLATFFLLRLVPGDPAAAILGDQASDASLAALREKMGLNSSIGAQLLDFMGQVFFHADTGNSLVFDVSSRQLIAARAGISMSLVALSVVFTAVIVVPMALLAATHRDRLLDQLIRIIPAIGLSMPIFWIGLLLVLVFAVRLGWLPVGGSVNGFASLILPALAVAITIAPPLIRSLRAQLLEVFQADFVSTLRAAGLPSRRILVRHVLRNAALPTLTLFGLNVAYLVGGTLIVEKVFAINGLGALMFEAIGNRDFPVVQGIALFSAVVVVAVTLVTDFAVHRLDPRNSRPGAQ
ncbi:ABC transporter permease [Nakamurella antarctica]|uniref:ABC transporter permease n=1 Tax=Nakamurella antarctica TaxID=1902245 RepID=A0A3G8ZU44_9ACTN|nr:ABC transporter permease [Nakamurella antarctica]AZI57536.1 ABC transporter permease [Nakamurella antarctica]